MDNTLGHAPVKPFYVEDHIQQLNNQQHAAQKKTEVIRSTAERQERFERLCQDVLKYFDDEWEGEYGKNAEASDKLLDTHKKAIIGYTQEVNYFKAKIDEYLKKNSLMNEWYPASYYENLTDAIFQENWGIAGISAWKNNHPNSSSAKIIGENIFYRINGKTELQEQKISPDRLKQFKKALLLRTPEKRLDEDYTEVYMLDGTRITIFDEPLAKEPVIIFRKDVFGNYTFEEQAERGTILKESIPLMKAWARIGFNLCFVGAVGTAKTAWLKTVEALEDRKLEGIQVETDPEIPQHKIKPGCPIIQLVADSDRLKKIVKPLMRGDGDYLIMAEARDGVALDIAVKMANKGTRRVKSTFHTSDPIDFPFDAATEIIREYGGDIFTTVIKVAKSYHYLPELIQLKDKSKKRLNALYEVRWDSIKHQISMHKIIKYDYKTDSWTFRYDIGQDKEWIGDIENPEIMNIFRNELKRLSEKYPMPEHESNVVYPFFNGLLGR